MIEREQKLRTVSVRLSAVFVFVSGRFLRELILLFVLFLSGKSAADVALGFVDVKDDARLIGERRVNLQKALGNILMYS